jgi:hypothetical protein
MASDTQELDAINIDDLVEIARDCALIDRVIVLPKICDAERGVA